VQAAGDPSKQSIRAFPAPRIFLRCPCCGAEMEGLTPHLKGDFWTKRQDDFLRTARVFGASIKTIAYVLHTSRQAVEYRLRALRDIEMVKP
jgi:hypothetical protein